MDNFTAGLLLVERKQESVKVRMKQYDLVMFDMDGTFMDSKKFHYEVFYRFLNAYVKNVTREEVEKGLGNTVREIFDSIGVEEKDLERVFAQLDEFCLTKIDSLAAEIRTGRGIRQTLARIKEKGIKIALVTNSMETVTERMLATHGLESFFDRISGADFFSINKIERCRKVADELHAKRILYVGDAEPDMELANEMGYDSCFAKTEISWYKDEEYILKCLKPTYVVEHLEDIVKYV